MTDLDAEQKEIYHGAPPTDSILVVGPPGTGKTVMAFHRAAFLQVLANKKKDKSLVPRVIMYSKVLSNYTSAREDVASGVETSTMHAWVYEWWRGIFRRKPPFLPEDRWRYDWTGMLVQVAKETNWKGRGGHWGHLIIDEGQDFPKEMYSALCMMSGLLNGGASAARPTVTVFADENQRLSADKNSAVNDIKDALSLKDDRVYSLRKNYRNSRQIAEFARHYFVGLPSGVPDLPERVGRSKPRVVITSELEVVRSRIAVYVANNPGLEVGVLCSGNAVRRRIFNSLSSRVGGKGIVVQTYSSGDDGHLAESLIFDIGGCVTVLNFQSAKGLEFDAVFLVNPFADQGGAGDQYASMQLYVMASRARDYLELLVMNQPPNLAERLPDKKLYEQITE
ncbi:ATP-binding domain-containing protein [Pseudomonas sp. BN102]|uniref:ATP-binding domain-containing protein n=1 Tax=Pseudomonas sp. BN102 TaxID=2567886 RepID=UPI0024545DCD|nr:ATP-binding domain-containing protein [Pseudomonas sp. BN102]